MYCLNHSRKKIVACILTQTIQLSLLIFFTACADPQKQSPTDNTPDTISHPIELDKEETPEETQSFQPADEISTGHTEAVELVEFARTLIGTHYLYASTDPSRGFDCSGFITYVFNHFNITVPRSSVDFTFKGKEVNETDARPGDIILFTGTDSTIRIVGHMGIITNNENGLIEFIHSTSGKQKGVVITPLREYYRGRFVKIIRVFPE